MEEKDLNLLWMFTLRIGMYTGRENSYTVSSFLHGYELGRENRCKFIEELIDSIERDYKIKNNAYGWVGQIERLAEKQNTDWITEFKKQSLKILNGRFSESLKKEFVDSMRKRMNGKASGVEHHFRKDWIVDWFGLVDLKANWFAEIWSKKEWQLILNIDEELKSFGKLDEMKSQVEPTEKLKILCGKLHEEMNQIENN